VPLEGHWERQNTPLRRVGRREVRVLAVVASVLVLALGVVVYSALHHGTPQAGPGCVDIITASTTGGAVVHACGAKAEHWCQLEAARSDAFARTAQARCRRAGYP
jgi:hypothetical protein